MFSSLRLKDRVRELEVQVCALQRELEALNVVLTSQPRVPSPKFRELARGYFRERADESQASQARVERPE